jgi:hypothetical protein
LKWLMLWVSFPRSRVGTPLRRSASFGHGRAENLQGTQSVRDERSHAGAWEQVVRKS